MKFLRKIQTKLFFTYLALTLITVVFMIVGFYRYIYTQIIEDLAFSRLEVMEHTANTINHQTDMLLFAISVGPFQSQFQSLLSEDMSDDPYEQLQLKNQAAALFRNYSDTYQNLKFDYYITLIGFNGFEYSSEAGFEYEQFCSSPWIDTILEQNGRVTWIPTMEDSFVPFSSKNICIMARSIRTGRPMQPVGILSIMINEDSLCRVYSAMNSADSVCFITDEDGRVISALDKELIGTVWSSPVSLQSVNGQSAQSISKDPDTGDEILYTCHRLNSSGWWLVESMPMHTLTRSSSRFMNIIWLISILCLFGGLLFSYIFSRHISRPIVALSHGMEEVAQGNLQVQLQDTSSTEMEYLINGFNRMSRDLSDLMERIKEQERHKRNAEIRFLQAQINPHFIYNTLNSVRCMTMMQQTDDAARVLVSIIAMMRTVLNTKTVFVPLDTELKFLENYLDIQQIIHSRKLSMELHISPHVHLSMIPKLILQPLVENSLFHGILPYNQDGNICIRAYREDTDDNSILHLVLTDNGHINPETLAKTRHRLDTCGESFMNDNSHIGLVNILLRIKQIYGEAYGLTIDMCENGQGTCVHLWFPNQTYDPDITMEELI